MRENVLNITAVMADGSIVKTAQRARKSSAGYDLTRLMVGAEGTLGLITELTVRLYGIPELILVRRLPVPHAGRRLQHRDPVPCSLASASRAWRCSTRPQVSAVNDYAKLGLEEKPTLFLEFHGTDVSARDQVETFRQIAESEGALRFDWAEKEEDRRRLWKARHEFYWAVKTLLARQGHVRHRHLRADLPARRMRGRDAERYRVAGPDRADRRPRRRRQLPHPADVRPSNPKEVEAVETFWSA